MIVSSVNLYHCFRWLAFHYICEFIHDCLQDGWPLYHQVASVSLQLSASREATYLDAVRTC